MPSSVVLFSYLFLLLMAYSFLGWCGEMVYCSLGQGKLCEKRGFLNGPLCPIYGHGALLVLTALGGSTNPLVTFAAGAVLTSAVEYVTSYLMEKLFHMRWWDYSHKRWNLNGRVCLQKSRNPPAGLWRKQAVPGNPPRPLPCSPADRTR